MLGLLVPGLLMGGSPVAAPIAVHPKVIDRNLNSLGRVTDVGLSFTATVTDVSRNFRQVVTDRDVDVGGS